MPTESGRNLLKELREFFNMPAGDFAREYKKLSDQDKKDLKAGIENGTLTY